MPKFLFKGNHEGIASKEVEVKGEAVTIDEVLELFEDFMRGMGYCIKYGEIQFVREDD